MAEKAFADGMIFKLPREGAPDYVKGSVSIKVAEFVAFLQDNEKNSGWVNIDLLVGKSGKPYAALNTYQLEKPDSLQEEEEPRDVSDHSDNVGGSEIPF
jgi:hypothetical protein